MARQVHQALIALLVACGGPARDPLVQPTAADLKPIETVPGLEQRKPDGALVDCRLSAFAREKFAGHKVIACGAVTHASGLPAWERTGRCLAKALEHRLPVIAEDQQELADSDIRTATIGVLEGTNYVVYRLSSDSDPCGGGCALKGGVGVERCTELLSPKFGCNGADCAGCGTWVREEPCRFTGPEKRETVEEVLGS